jgi:hypothetical protein
MPRMVAQGGGAAHAQQRARRAHRERGRDLHVREGARPAPHGARRPARRHLSEYTLKSPLPISILRSWSSPTLYEGGPISTYLHCPYRHYRNPRISNKYGSLTRNKLKVSLL